MDELSFQFISIIITMIIPLLFVSVLLGKSDSRPIVLFFCWGRFAGALAFILNTYIGRTFGQFHRMSLTIAPIIEELCKGLPLLLFLNTKRYARITKVIIFCAMVSGIGFSVQESMYYFSISSRELSDVGMLIARSLTTALLHGMTTATIGAGLMFFQRQNHIIVPLIITLFAFSSGIHALFNLLLQTKLMIVAMSIPYAMFVAGFAFIEREIPDYSQRT